jgi:hypothetical protein
MRALLAIRERKKVTSIGTWQSGKRMPRTAFPLSKSHSYPLGSSFDWCVVETQSDERAYRLLVAFDWAKAQYRAWLGMIDGADQALIARLEFHPSHKGWHCHVKSGPIDGVARGVVKESGSRDRCRICNVDQTFSVTQLDALNIAFHAFNVDGALPPKEGELFT